MLRKLNFVHISLAIIMAVVITAIYTFSQTSHIHSAQHTNHMDYFGLHVIQTRFDASGHHISHSSSPNLYHIPKNDTVFIKKPHNVSWSAQQGSWTLQANQAAYHQQSNITHMTGGIIITKQGSRTEPPTIIHTDHAIYNGNTHIAKTDAFVTIDQGKNHQEGTGAIVNFKDKTIRLLSGTRGHYVNQ